MPRLKLSVLIEAKLLRLHAFREIACDGQGTSCQSESDKWLALLAGAYQNLRFCTQSRRSAIEWPLF